MSGLKRAISEKNIASGWLYFYVHFVTEVICFYCLGKETGDSVFLWLFPFVYDAFAFVPQSVFGFINDRFPKINMGIAGIAAMSLSAIMFRAGIFPNRYIPLIILCLGNAMTHIGGAETTLRSSGGHLAHPAIFVAGGSFGVITGRLLAKTFIPYWLIILLALSGIPFALLAETYNKTDISAKELCGSFNFANKKIPASAVIVLATMVVMVRGYMGYGIPTAWNKTVFQTVMLYVSMGIGKAAGGILSDAFGARRIAVISIAAALPFLMLGDNHMMVSLFGVMLFSMTMSITLGILVSVLKNNPGLAFGFTTIGLFLGTAPIFFFKFTTASANCIMIAVLTVVCLAAMLMIMRKDGKADE